MATRNEQVHAAVQRMKPKRRFLASDLIAALTFAVVNVPQAMAHALLATVNPLLGIYTLMIAVPIGTIFSSSVFMNVSTTGALAVAAGVVLVDFPDDQKLPALVVLVLLVGVIQLLAGLFRLGFLIRFVSNAVMTGFLNGVAVLIILGQLSDLTGFQSSFSNRVAQALDLLLRIGQISVPDSIIGGVTLVLIVALLFLKRLQRYAFIIAIAAATILLVVLNLPFMPTATYFGNVPMVGDIAAITRSLPELMMPQPALVMSLLLPAFSVAVIGLVQGAGVSQGTPNPDGQYPNVSRDFLGQGAANMATSIVGGIPAGGSVSGTVLMMSAGARSRWGNIFVGLFVALIVLLAGPLVERVPMPALAALLIVAGFQGLRIEQAVMAWQTGRISRLVMLATFLATLTVPLQFAVLFGVVLSILLNTIRQSNKVVVTQWVLQAQGFPVEQPPPERLPSHQLTLLHVYGSLFFAAAKNIEEMLPEVGDSIRAVVAINLRGISEIGSTYMTVLQRYAQALQARQGKLMLVGVDPLVRDQLAKTGVLKLIGDENVFVATPQIGEALNRAVAAASAWIEQEPIVKAPGTT
ncbi:MAG: SulP family inorganic anion transporter [Candidatus Accumulibacter sp.]|uniref:SulP family inorganic anion transporter n=1 Tax=Candidatus Accumulibacter affinis TaxID=2954384 RepID=A0A935W5M7_9PROT|nr:SulP family inorganic anion transporter [Candidatus Accumulibacter affinis]